MSKSQFLDKQNIATLWDVISDEELFKTHNADVKNTILQLFSDNIKGFYNSESKNSKITLMEMNKKYILMVLNFIKTYYPKPSINKIVIKEEISLNNKDLITVEERKQERMTEFDSKLHLVEEEFKNAMALPMPEKPNFSDNVKEKPIIEMEKAIKEITEQRNYEIQQINQQTNEKIAEQTTSSIQNNNMNNNMNNVINSSSNRLKHIKPTENNRHIHWADQSSGENISLELEEKDIFSKLKPISRETNDNRIHNLEETVNTMKTELNELKTSISEILTIIKNNKNM